MTSGPAPLISVVNPVYDGERYLGEPIESTLAQAHTALEITAVDEGRIWTESIAVQGATSHFTLKPSE